MLGGLGAARGLPARLRHHHPRRLFSDPDHAAGAGLPRRRLRVPLPRRRRIAPSGTTASATARPSRPSRRASCSAPSSRASRSRDGHFAGSSFDCFTPFSVLTGVALLFGYALLGAGWLILKTRRRAAGLGARARAASAFSASLVAVAVVSLWTPLHGAGDRRALVLVAEHRAAGARCRSSTALSRAGNWRALEPRSAKPRRSSAPSACS